MEILEKHNLTKNSFDGLESRSNTVEEKMSELEDRIIKLPKLKLREKKTSMKKMTSVTCGTRSHDLA